MSAAIVVRIQPGSSAGAQQSAIPWRGPASGARSWSSAAILLLIAAAADAATAPPAPATIWVDAKGETSISLSWTAAGPDVDANLVGFRVYRNGVLVATVPAAATASTGLLVDSGLVPGTAYAYKVVAYDATGLVSPDSPTLNTRTYPAGTIDPPTPTNLVATPAGPSAIALSWTPVTSAVPITAYIVAGESLDRWPVPSLRVSTASAVLRRLPTPNGYPYTFLVYAVDQGGGMSAPATIGPITPPADTIPPTTPGGLTVTTVTASSIALSWTASTDDVAVTGYYVLASPVAVGWPPTPPAVPAVSLRVAGTSAVLSAMPTGEHLMPGIAYTVSVAALQPDERVGSLGAVATVTTLAAPTPVSAPTAPVATSLGFRSFNIAWGGVRDVRGTSGYDVLIDGAVVGSVTAPSQGFGCAVDLPGRTYRVAVRARDRVGNPLGTSPETPITTLSERNPPLKPTYLAAAGHDATSITLLWQIPPDVGGSGVRQCVVARNGVVIATTSATSFRDVPPGVGTFSYTVQAVDWCGNASPPSQPLTVALSAVVDRTPPSAPPPPTLSLAGAHAVALTWPPALMSDGVVAYRVARAIGSPYALPGYLGTTAGTTFTDAASPALGQAVYYAIQAIDAAGNQTAYPTFRASIIVPRDPTPPLPPAAVRIVRQQPLAMELEWDAGSDVEGVRGYLLATGEYPADARTATIPGLYPDVATVDFASQTASARAPFAAPVDSVPPSAATGLRVDWQTRTRIGLAWNDGVDATGAATATLLMDGAPMPIGDLVPGSAHTFVVDTVDNAGNHALGNPSLTVIQPADTVPPGPPGFPRFFAQPTSFSLTWQPAHDDDGSEVWNYELMVDGVAASVTGTSGGLLSAQPGRSYAIALTAIDLAGNRSIPVTLSLRTPPAPLHVPKDLHIAASTATTLTLAWSPPDDVVGIAGYEVQSFGVPLARSAVLDLTQVVGRPVGDIASVWTVRAYGTGTALRWTDFAMFRLGANNPSILVRPVAFDAARWAADGGYRAGYLARLDPARVWQSAPPGPTVPTLRSSTGRRVAVAANGTVSIGAVGAANGPVTFLCTGSGTFPANQGNLITVLADGTGLAAVDFRAPAAGRIPIIAASPLAAGHLRFLIEVAP